MRRQCIRINRTMRLMKTTLIACFLLAASITAYSQHDSRLEARFSPEQIAQMEEQHPSVLAYWNFYLDNAYTIQDIPQQKLQSMQNSIRIKDLNSFNILDTDLTMKRHGKQYFRIEGTQRMLVLYSNSEFTEMFNAQRNK